MMMKENWKPVTIGSTTGILMGAGAMYAAQAIASDNHEVPTTAVEESLKVATVDDSMSFREAFDAARAQVGAGGVFTWHGHVFNTYTAAEWKAMSNHEKHLFAEQVKPEISASEVNTKLIAQETADDDTDDVRVLFRQDGYEAKMQTVTWNELADDDNDVRVIGFKDVEIGDGHSLALQEYDVSGQRVAVIDVDKDGDPDWAVTDLNHNHQMEMGEVIDLHTGETLTFTNSDSSADNLPDIDTPTF